MEAEGKWNRNQINILNKSFELNFELPCLYIYKIEINKLILLNYFELFICCYYYFYLINKNLIFIFV